MKIVTTFPDPEDDRKDPASFFVGREQELSALSEIFRAGKRSVQISGNYGMGKTALAWMFAEQNREQFPGGVFKAHAYAPEGVAPMLKRAIQTDPKGPALLIIDDAESLDEEDLQALRTRIATMPALKVLLTTRQPLPTSGSDEEVLQLGPMSQEEVRNLLARRLEGVPEEDARRLYELLQGNPALTDLAGRSVRDGIVRWNELLRMLHDFEFPGILGPDGRPVTAGSVHERGMIVEVREANEEILRLLKRDPELLRSLPPRKFEEIIADLLRKQGYQVTLTPATKDGGIDMYAAKKDGLGTFLYLVECKRYTPPNKVGVSVIRSLYGVLQSRKATAGVIVTSSFFTKGAREFQQENFYQLQLHDYLGIQNWLGQYVE